MWFVDWDLQCKIQGGGGGSHSNNGKVKGRRNEEIDVNRRYGGTRDREGSKQWNNKNANERHKKNRRNRQNRWRRRNGRSVRLAKKVGCKTLESLVRPRLICCQTERVWQVAGSILFHRLWALCFTLYESGKKVSAEKTAVRGRREAE